MFKKIWSLFKTRPELVSPLADSVSASALPSATTIPPRLVRSRRKRKKSEPDWISVPQEPTTAELLLGLPNEYKVLNDLLVTNPKSRSGYSQIDHVVIGPRAIFVIETRNLTTGDSGWPPQALVGEQQPGQDVQSAYAAPRPC